VRRHTHRVVVSLLARGVPLDAAEGPGAGDVDPSRAAAARRPTAGAAVAGTRDRSGVVAGPEAGRTRVRREALAGGIIALESEREGFADPTSDPERQAMRREQLELVRREVDRCPARAREVFRAVYDERTPTHAEVAHELACRCNACARYCARSARVSARPWVDWRARTSDGTPEPDRDRSHRHGNCPEGRTGSTASARVAPTAPSGSPAKRISRRRFTRACSYPPRWAGVTRVAGWRVTCPRQRRLAVVAAGAWFAASRDHGIAGTTGKSRPSESAVPSSSSDTPGLLDSPRVRPRLLAHSAGGLLPPAFRARGVRRAQVTRVRGPHVANGIGAPGTLAVVGNDLESACGVGHRRRSSFSTSRCGKPLHRPPRACPFMPFFA